MPTKDEIKNAKALLRLFKIDGKRADQVATQGQIEIFHAIISRKWDRVQIISSTQYGKSLFIALGCIILSAIEEELVCIVAPTNAKAQIIMRYYIQHLSDHSVFRAQLEKENALEKLQMETKKDRILLKNRGGVFTLSVQAGNTQKGFQAAMGEGARIVIQDESSLIPDDIESTIYRMIAGKQGAMYVKVGNPFYRNHFYRSSVSPEYHQIFIDYKRAISEGRYNEKFIEEAKNKPHFDILYGCVFPPDDVTDASGYTRLYPDYLIAQGQRANVFPYGENRLGADIAEGGGDTNALVLRSANLARIIDNYVAADTMQTAGRIIHTAKELDVYDHNIFIDSLGVGKGVFDRVAEQGLSPFPVKNSEKASDEQQFANLRAECYWQSYQWLSQGGLLEPNKKWEQLSWIRYKTDSSGRIQIQPKDELRRMGYPSPDVVDAFVMTFARRSIVNKSREERKKEYDLLKQFDAFKDRNQLSPVRRLRRYYFR